MVDAVGDRGRVFLTAPHYELGEIDDDHATIPGLHERARQFRMPPDAQTWGWGRVRRTRRCVEELAVDSGSATMRAAAVDPASIDMFLLCSTRFPHGADSQGRFMQRIMEGLGIGGAPFAGVAMNRCANLLSALQLAELLVSSRRYRRVLVVTTDRVEDETQRMESFALFSDGAASCLVLDDCDGPAGYELVSSAAAQDASALGSSNEISSDLSRQVNDSLLTPLGMTPAQISGLMHANVFKPIVTMKELQAGFTPSQLYIDNILRLGHCFAADPVINLVDRAEAGQVRAGGYYLLASSVPGTRIGVLLRRLG
jgi:3-oxoacyl-[acyl-carrier-protein] synthase III